MSISPRLWNLCKTGCFRITGQSFPNPVKANSLVAEGIDRDFHGFPSTDYGCLIWF
jgi:hypothetical protein